jgi:hypothetical protein
MHRYFLSIRAFLAVSAAIAAVLAFAGCGGSDSSSAASEGITVQTASVSKGQFIKKADAICAASKRKLEVALASYFKTGKRPSNEAEQNAWVKKYASTVLLPNYEKRIDELSAAGAPSADQSEVTAILESLQHSLDKIRQDPIKTSSDGTIFVKPAKLASGYGLSGCAETFGA